MSKRRLFSLVQYFISIFVALFNEQFVQVIIESKSKSERNWYKHRLAKLVLYFFRHKSLLEGGAYSEYSNQMLRNSAISVEQKKRMNGLSDQ